MPGTIFVNPIYRPIYWSYRATGGLWYWARRRFTQAGAAAVVALFATGVAGVDIENTVTYQAFALLLALLLFSFFSASGFPQNFPPRVCCRASARRGSRCSTRSS